MKWIKGYEDLKVDLVGDEITKGRIWLIQMLYEYGIRSTYLQGIKDQRMTSSEHISSSSLLSFCVPLCPTKSKIEGLNIITLYRSSGSENEHINTRVLFAKISNKTKGLTWIYNPVVYCKTIVDEDAVWLSYWPIGNVLDAGDEVDVSIIVGGGLIVSGCGASLVYTDCDIHLENTNTKGDEVIDGDLSEFELTKGVYYLCRRDFFKSTIPDWFKMLLGELVILFPVQSYKNGENLISRNTWIHHFRILKFLETPLTKKLSYW